MARGPLIVFVANVLLVIAGLCIGVSTSIADEPHTHLRSVVRNGILLMNWQGPVAVPMSDEIRAAYEQNKDSIRGVAFKIDSGGGSVKEGERVIAVLQDIKKRYELRTIVGAGQRCGSMCVFIYLQGQKRYGASASLWLFHEVSYQNPKTHQVTRLDRAAWEKLVDTYWVPAGVDPKWIDTVKTHTLGSDYWQSGESLINDHANIITNVVSDEHRRNIASSTPASTPVVAAKLCPQYSATANGMVDGPCN